jgi:Arc/MetJ family transcription regulator
MQTTILIDEELLRQAMSATGLKTKRAVVEAGLRALIQSKGHIGARQGASDMRSDENSQDIRRAVIAASHDLRPSKVRRRNNG